MIAAGNDALFAKLCTVLNRPKWSQDNRFRTNSLRVQHRTVLTSMLQERFRSAGMASWQAQLDAAGIPNAPLRSTAEVMADPQTLALDILQDVPRTKALSVGIPVRFDGVRPRLRLPAPSLGEHTADILETGHG